MVRSLSFLVALSALAACAPNSEQDDGFAPSPAVADALADVPVNPESQAGLRAVVLTATPLIPGDDVTFTITGANPNEQVHITRSTSGVGAGPCLGTAGLLCLDITNPVLHGSVFADAYGVATLTQTLPTAVPIGGDVWFQAIIPRGASGAAWVKSVEIGVQIQDAALNVSNVAYSDLIFTEVMQNPDAVADADGEWFEVYNTTTEDMNLAGMQFTDFVTDTFTVASTVFVPAGGYVVFGRNADPTTNGGLDVDYEYGNMDLANGIDEIHVLAGATIIDAVTWDDGISFPDPVGASMELDRGHYDADGNDAGANWAEADEAYGLGDLGTPGASKTFVLTPVGTHSSVGVLSGDDWTVCRADELSAWLCADISGQYNAVEACASLGYPRVTAWGGTSSLVCNVEVFTGGGGSDPTLIQSTVHWLCEI